MKVWIYLDKRQQGPYELEELADIAGFNENTRVWFEGLPKWYPAGTLDQLRPLFDGTITRGEHTAEAVADSSSEADTTSTPEQSSVEATGTDTPRVAAPVNRYAPGYVPQRNASMPSEPCPPSYLGWSVFLLVCCCSPLSLAAVAASIFVTSYYSSGRLDQAKKASEVAAWLVMISFALGLIPLMIMSSMFG